MNLAEYLGQTNIFTELMEVGSNPIFNIENNQNMNMLLKLNHGDKVVFDKFNTISIKEVAQMLMLQHGKNWQRVIDVSVNGLNIGASSVHTVTETTTETESRINSREDLNKVSAYNSDELVTNDGTNSNNNENVNGDKTRILTDEVSDYATQFNNLSLSIKNNIIDIVITDVSNFLTLSIYG